MYIYLLTYLLYEVLCGPSMSTLATWSVTVSPSISAPARAALYTRSLAVGIRALHALLFRRWPIVKYESTIHTIR